MIKCLTCGQPTNETSWGPWCDPCGGVSTKPGQVMFRHVATVEGPGGRFPIVYDMSTSDYAYMHKTPNSPNNARDLDGFRRPSVRVSHGSLDAVIAVSYPDIRGEDGGDTEISAAPSATEGERHTVLEY